MTFKKENVVSVAFKGVIIILLLSRVMSAAIGIPLLLLMVYEGKFFFLLGLLLITFLGILELKQLLGYQNLKIPSLLIYGSGILYPLLAFFTPKGLESEFIVGILTFVLLYHLLIMAIFYPRYSVNELAASFLGSCYVGLLISYLIFLRRLFPFGLQYVLLVFILIWTCDTGAYVGGRLIGRHALSPLLSPQKTIEGSITGLLSCIVVSFLIHKFYPLLLPSIYAYLLLGILIGIFGQVGDLVESALKRFSNVKNSSGLIPGHGGVLDRFDSLFFCTPIAYFYIKFFL